MEEEDEIWIGFWEIGRIWKVEKRENIIPGIIPEIEGSMNIYIEGEYEMFGGTANRSVWLEEMKLRHTVEFSLVAQSCPIQDRAKKVRDKARGQV